MKNILPTLPTDATVKQLRLNWLKTLPINIGDLFTYETERGIARFDSFLLNPELVKFIVYELNQSRTNVNNVHTLSVVMGRGPFELSKEMTSGPSDQIFVPILKVELNEERSNQRVFYFFLTALTESYSVISPGFGRVKDDTDDELSPKVAELFILHWQTLSEAGVVNAFDGIAPESISKVVGEKTVSILFGAERLQRVREYIFIKSETKSIVDKLRKHLEDDKKVDLFVHLGSGLEVLNFHPFNFRPILKIVASEENASEENAFAKSDSVDIEYFDTSKPCPPYCPD